MTVPADPEQASERLVLERTFAAPPERIFDAWTKPDILQSWFAPGDGFDVTAEADPAPGGRFRIALRHRESGAEHIAVGAYEEVDRPRRIVCTWQWEQGDEAGGPETLLSLDFEVHGADTLLRLTHERFPTAEIRDHHMQGWTGCLARLIEHLTA